MEAAFTSRGMTYYDLTQPTPMFEPMAGNPTEPNLRKPLSGSQPTAGHGGFQGVRTAKPDLPAARGHFRWGNYFLDEHYATHVDAQCHFVTTDPALSIDDPDRRDTGDFTLHDLIGPLVYVDIRARVEQELARNQGIPSPDPAITDFGNASQATVRLPDIEPLEPHIVDSAFIVINTGWDRFFWGAPPDNGWLHPYVNGLNHPGLTPEATDWLMNLEERKGIRINGIVADNIAVESGESLVGPGGSVQGEVPILNGPYLHAVGLQRGWKLVENVTNLGSLANHRQGTGTLIAGAARIAGLSGAPARVIAMYPDGAGSDRDGKRAATQSLSMGR